MVNGLGYGLSNGLGHGYTNALSGGGLNGGLGGSGIIGSGIGEFVCWQKLVESI